MNQWAFVMAAYLVVVLGVIGLLGWSIAALRRAESRADALSERR